MGDGATRSCGTLEANSTARDRPRPPATARDRPLTEPTAPRPPPTPPPASPSPVVGEGEAEEYAGWFKALADPTRLRILNLLATSEAPVCVCGIVDRFPLGQPAISHHLKILRQARFVVAEWRGTSMDYRVNRACVAEFPEAARRILNA